MYLITRKPLTDGAHEREGFEWKDAEALGLREADYGFSWWVHPTRAAYLGSL